MKQKLITAAGILILSAFLISCGGETESKSESSVTASDAVSFEVYDTKGKLRNASEWIGKQPVVINVWGTWCPPCRAEMPALVKAYEEYKNKGIEIIGMAVGRDTPQTVEMFASQNNVNWQMMMGTKEFAQKFQLSSVPSTIFVDRNGKVMKVFSPRTQQYEEVYIGALSYELFTKYLDTLLSI